MKKTKTKLIGIMLGVVGAIGGFIVWKKHGPLLKGPTTTPAHPTLTDVGKVGDFGATFKGYFDQTAMPDELQAGATIYLVAKNTSDGVYVIPGVVQTVHPRDTASDPTDEGAADVKTSLTDTLIQVEKDTAYLTSDAASLQFLHDSGLLA